MSQAKLAKLSKPKVEKSNAYSSVPRRSASYVKATNQPTSITLYDYAQVESATNILRYRHFIKRHQKLYKELFTRYEGNNTKSSRVPKSQLTFDV